MTLYHLNVTVHVLAAFFWIGGMFFLGIVGAPVLRQVEPAALRAKLFHDLGVRFRSAGWTAVAVLLMTGVFNLHQRGVLGTQTLGSMEFWNGGFGRMLAWKLGAVAAMIALSAWHDFVLGPRAARARPGSAEALALRGRAAWTARLNALIGLILVIVAVRLARGG